MIKSVKISGKEYVMQSSAWTQFAYKNETGRKLLDDLKEITKLKNAKTDVLLSKYDDVVEILLRIAYTMIQENDKNQVSSFEDFLKSITNLFEDTDWISDVVDLAQAPISGGNKRTSPQSK